jgi:hypothetical protein
LSGSQAYRNALAGDYTAYDKNSSIVAGNLLVNSNGSARIYTQIEADAQGYITISSPGEYVGNEYWGSIKPFSAGIVFRDCIFHGADPTKPSAGSQWGCFKSYDTSAGHWVAYDCTIDPMPWVSQRGKPYIFPGMYGIHGSDFEIYRCEIKNVIDGINLVRGGTRDPYSLSTTIQASWIHACTFQNNLDNPLNPNGGPSDNRSHCDSIQFNNVKNVDILDNWLGGTRDMAGYRAWGYANQPTSDISMGRCTGDDYWNSCFQIGQEVDDTVANRNEFVSILRNVLVGGTAGINHAYKASAPSNDYSTWEVAYNKFDVRGSDWGTSADSASTYGTSGPGGNGAGYYAIVYAPYQAAYHDNIRRDTGLPVVITNG